MDDIQGATSGLQALRVLLQTEADVNASAAGGLNALHMAVRYIPGEEELQGMIDLLLDAGLDRDATTLRSVILSSIWNMHKLSLFRVMQGSTCSSYCFTESKDNRCEIIA